MWAGAPVDAFLPFSHPYTRPPSYVSASNIDVLRFPRSRDAGTTGIFSFGGLAPSSGRRFRFMIERMHVKSRTICYVCNKATILLWRNYPFFTLPRFDPVFLIWLDSSCVSILKQLLVALHNPLQYIHIVGLVNRHQDFCLHLR